MDMVWAEVGSECVEGDCDAGGESDAWKALPVVEEDDISAAARMLGRWICTYDVIAA
jgi:hypothetical protein